MLPQIQIELTSLTEIAVETLEHQAETELTILMLQDLLKLTELTTPT
jgi:hypothetical protein